ncbi:tigger transposable element-derived protein 6 [Brienomyrus brachyistius]|uniref:tigger transposable element-derived protein 6 n=1 Tax=Brienomyrus brachyistius TaxID=42636 RepID=UPI0020B1BA7B|nr:tigger transposable element-derived protein 6 [Brienomyrus brachyistius]
MTGKRKSFSLNDKRRLIEAYDKLPKMSQRAAARKLGIPQATLCTLLKRRQIVPAANNGDRRRIRSGKAPVVEAALVKWIDNAKSCNAPLSGPLVKEKAEELAAKLGEDNFKVSIGWFERFKKRENIVFKKLHGEAAEADMVSPGEWLEDQWQQMRQEYTEENIWNAAESGIYFRALPHSTFTFRSDNKIGGKKLKERITALFACSAVGEKKELFVIGRSHNPRCFNYVHTLPVRYAASAPAWMTRNLFVGWLKEWDRKLAQERRKILLLVDSSPAHDMTNTTLRNIRVEFLPKNATSFLQPCDQGIIRTAKAYFRKEMARTVLQKVDEGSPATAVDIVKKISLLDAVLMLRDAWADVGASTIRDCWRKVGLVMSLKEELETIDPPAEISAEEFEHWIAVDDSTPVSEPVTDDDIIAAVKEGFGMGTDTSDEEEEKVETVVPSRAEMRNAIRILKTGLPHVGFNNFDLLHQFAKEVNLVLDKTTIRICEMTYPHVTEPIHKTEVA